MMDLPVWETKQVLVSYLEDDARDRVRQIAQTLCDFLIQHELLKSDCSIKQEKVTDDLVLLDSDLNELGLKVVSDGMDRWLRSVSDLRKPVTTTSLERTLERVLKNSN